jgi:predicted DNA-binding WGR domain protein
MSDAKQIPSHGWYLENRDNNRFAFYTVILTETGLVVFHWGRIGTAGQTKMQMLPPSQAKMTAMRQVASKMGRGYEVKHDDVTFMLDERDVTRAHERPDPKSLTLLFDRALRDPVFTGDKDNVVQAYDVFLERAQRLMDNAAQPTTRFDSVWNDFDDLKAAWAEIEDKHSLAQTTLDMTSRMLTQALMAGRLT